MTSTNDGSNKEENLTKVKNMASVDGQQVVSVDCQHVASVDYQQRASVDNVQGTCVDAIQDASVDKTINSGGVSQGNKATSSLTDHNHEARSSRSNLPPQRKWTKSHPFELIIGETSSRVKTRRATQEECLYNSFISKEEPKKLEDALMDPDWVLEMQEELN